MAHPDQTRGIPNLCGHRDRWKAPSSDVASASKGGPHISSQTEEAWAGAATAEKEGRYSTRVEVGAACARRARPHARRLAWGSPGASTFRPVGEATLASARR